MGARRTAATAAVLAFAATVMFVPPVGRASTSVAPFPLDATWAANQPVPGLIRLQLDNLPDYASLVRVLPDGSAIVALGGISPTLGYGDGRQGIAKLRADGTLDPTFNPTGIVPGVVDQLTTTGIIDIDIDHHGRILIAGTYMITRLLADGTADPRFVATCITPCVPGQGEPPPVAPTGMVYVQSRVYDMAVLGDDSIIVESSNEINQPPFVMHVSKLTATGDRDLTFNPADATPGVLTVDDYGPGHILTQANGSYLLAALSSPSRLHRITAGGLFDTTYGTAGTEYPPVAHSDEGIGQAVASGSDIVISLARSFPPGPPTLARLHPDGTTDTTFGNGGRLDLTGLVGSLNISEIFILSDGRIIVEVSDPATTSALARLTADGHLDASFNRASSTPGWLTVNPAPDPNHGHIIFDLTETINGRLLAVGDRPLHGYPSTDEIAEIYRFNAFPGPPQPIEPYPISSPPPPLPIATIDAAATVGKPAVRLTPP